MSERPELSAIPAQSTGRWAVISSQTPDGDKLGGEILDYWEWSATSVESSDWRLIVKSVVADIEDHQDVHLINFTNNMQFAVMRSENQPDVILVVE